MEQVDSLASQQSNAAELQARISQLEGQRDQALAEEDQNLAKLQEAVASLEGELEHVKQQVCPVHWDAINQHPEATSWSSHSFEI